MGVFVLVTGLGATLPVALETPLVSFLLPSSREVLLFPLLRGFSVILVPFPLLCIFLSSRLNDTGHLRIGTINSLSCIG